MNEQIKQINWKIFEKFQERDDRTNSTYQRRIKELKNGIKEKSKIKNAILIKKKI